MVPERYRTPEEVKRYLTPLFPAGTTFNLYRSEYGWVFQRIPFQAGPAQQDRRRPHPGQVRFVLDARTGVVTTHPSLPLRTIGQMYDQAIRDGRPVLGNQVYPLRWRVKVQRISQDENMIRYQVSTEPLAADAEPVPEHILTITKFPFDYQTDAPGVVTESCARAIAWVDMRRRSGQGWPERGTLDY
ncbi:hypothetical protein [Nocardia yamanashiensis]|uniref:hypothetical protein n=1 Tax=Nocardia yamanashiensis TaxID=209247 RepID=UPI0008324441|nr:hypothetical protein [Nocardia yamanashiensis]